MSKLQIITDPNEFVEKTNIQSENIYVFLEEMFTMEKKSTNEILDVVEKYNPACMFTNVKIKTTINYSIQYYKDINYGKERDQILICPIILKYIPKKLKIYPDLTYHSFSFLTQAKQITCPWHIPQSCFTMSMKSEQLEKLINEAKWVTQYVT